jgi:hypothetical protein
MRAGVRMKGQTAEMDGSPVHPQNGAIGAAGGMKENEMTTVTSKDKDAETTELSRDQLDQVAGGIYFEVPKLQPGTPLGQRFASPVIPYFG